MARDLVGTFRHIVVFFRRLCVRSAPLGLSVMLHGCAELNCDSTAFSGTVQEVTSETQAGLFVIGAAVHFDIPRRVHGNRYSMLVEVDDTANLGFFSTQRRAPECPVPLGHWKVLSKSDLAPDYPDATLDVTLDEATLVFYPDGEEVRVEMDVAADYP